MKMSLTEWLWATILFCFATLVLGANFKGLDSLVGADAANVIKAAIVTGLYFALIIMYDRGKPEPKDPEFDFENKTDKK